MKLGMNILIKGIIINTNVRVVKKNIFPKILFDIIKEDVNY
jgi:hypothetical protein